MTKDQFQFCKNEVLLNGVSSLTKSPYNLNFKDCEVHYPPFHACIFAQGFKNCQGPLWLKSKFVLFYPK